MTTCQKGVKPGTKRGPYKSNPDPEKAKTFSIRVSNQLYLSLKNAGNDKVRNWLNNLFLTL